VASGTPVAVKSLRAANAPTPFHAATFEAEARAFAALDSPSIVRVYDYGRAPLVEVDPRIPAGSPWLAMEYVGGGPLGARHRSLPWPDLRAVLLDVLAGLAHAHARGVLHRDIKPDNILLELSAGPGAGRARITDFGLARILDDQADEGRVSGTPLYMAPEQVNGQTALQGPWTDLYAVGCVAWTLLAGRPMFAGNALQVMRAQLMRTPPPLPESVDVPSGLRDWLDRLLEKRPEERFQHAADAARSLVNLDSDQPTGAPSLPARPLDRRTSGAPRLLTGAGLGVFGLREIPVVGRQTVRDRLWEALEDVSIDGAARAVVLRGPAGVGKSRLARWLGVEAAESGAGDLLRATHGPVPGGLDGLRGLLARRLGTAASRVDKFDRARRLLGDHGHAARAVVEIADPPPDPAHAFRFPSPGARYEAVATLLRCIRTRTPVLWLDDAQWGVDTLRFAHHLLTAEEPVPCLLVVTIQDEALAERAAASAALAALTEHSRVDEIPLAPLEADERRALIRGLLGLEPRLARRIEERTDGNPLFAVQLVGDWIERGLLHPGAEGFEIAVGADVSLPPNIGAVWAERLAAMLDDDEAARRALELGATLGGEVFMTEWLEALGDGADGGRRMLDIAAARALVVTDGDRSWRFVHGMFRETVLAAAEAGGRLEALHAACARAVRAVHPGRDERIGRHHLAAGEPTDAFEPLLQASRTRAIGGRGAEAQELSALARRALSGRSPQEAVDEHVRLLLTEAGVALTEGPAGAPGRLHDKAEALARAHGSPNLQAEVASHRARVFANLGRVEEAREQIEAALAVADGPDGDGAPSWMLVTAALVSARLGRTEPAMEFARRAVQASAAEGPYTRAAAELRFGIAAMHAGRTAEARTVLTALAEDAKEASYTHIELRCWNTLGEIARAEGDLRAAAAAYRQALAVPGQGASGTALVRVNVGLVALLRGRLDAARDLGRAVVDWAAPRGERFYALFGRLLVLPATSGEWAAWDPVWEDVDKTLGDGMFREDDLATTLRLIADAADAAGSPERSARVHAVLDVYRARFGQDGAAASV